MAVDFKFACVLFLPGCPGLATDLLCFEIEKLALLAEQPELM